MTVVWKGFLELAKTLNQEAIDDGAALPSTNIKLRTSISRSYYSAFHEAKEYIRDVDGKTIPDDGSVHSFVIDGFIENDNRVRKKIGTNLKRLKTNRSKADYKDFISGLPSLTVLSIHLADKIISGLSKI